MPNPSRDKQQLAWMQLVDIAAQINEVDNDIAQATKELAAINTRIRYAIAGVSIVFVIALVAAWYFGG